MINHYDALGVNFRPIRQSEGATVILERGISRRLVGLPLSASVANFRMAPRADGWPGAQNVEPLTSFTYNSTRSPAPVAALAGAVHVTDFASTVSSCSDAFPHGVRCGFDTCWDANTSNNEGGSYLRVTGKPRRLRSCAGPPRAGVPA